MSAYFFWYSKALERWLIDLLADAAGKNELTYRAFLLD